MTGNLLKLIAVVTMLLDHIGAAVVGRVFRRALSLGGMGGETEQRLYASYMVLRLIGRIAFPIFCYFVVEGYLHTRDARRYALRLGLFALLSEIPFDLAFNGELLEFGYQNIYFTLLLGLIGIWLIDLARRREWVPGNAIANTAVRGGLSVCAAAGAMALAELLSTDYGWGGVAAILVLYVFRGNKWLQLTTGYLTFMFLIGGLEPAALPAFILLAFYNGKRGAQLKYFYYAFYPVHLLVLYLVCILMGIAGYSSL